MATRPNLANCPSYTRPKPPCPSSRDRQWFVAAATSLSASCTARECDADAADRSDRVRVDDALGDGWSGKMSSKSPLQPRPRSARVRSHGVTPRSRSKSRTIALPSNVGSPYAKAPSRTSAYSGPRLHSSSVQPHAVSAAPSSAAPKPYNAAASSTRLAPSRCTRPSATTAATRAKYCSGGGWGTGVGGGVSGGGGVGGTLKSRRSPMAANGSTAAGVGVIAEIQRAASASDSAAKSGLRPPTRSTRRK
mmetsp:Transcript_7616/g.20080  ORF Transcript_7616/g.20080 Transcript_7616/m.20080 type:complete len:249 (+) Transcript_7616:785-1531(+)